MRIYTLLLLLGVLSVLISAAGCNAVPEQYSIARRANQSEMPMDITGAWFDPRGETWTVSRKDGADGPIFMLTKGSLSSDAKPLPPGMMFLSKSASLGSSVFGLGFRYVVQAPDIRNAPPPTTIYDVCIARSDMLIVHVWTILGYVDVKSGYSPSPLRIERFELTRDPKILSRRPQRQGRTLAESAGDMDSPDPMIRLEAIRELVASKTPEANDLLIKALQDRMTTNKILALRGLAHSDETAAAGPMFWVMMSGGMAGEQARMSLIELGPEAAGNLLAYLKPGTVLSGEKGVPATQPTASNNTREQCWKRASALSWIFHEWGDSALPAIKQALAEGDGTTVEFIFQFILPAMKSSKAADIVMAYLEKKPLAKKRYDVTTETSSAVQALGKIGDPRGAKILAQYARLGVGSDMTNMGSAGLDAMLEMIFELDAFKEKIDTTRGRGSYHAIEVRQFWEPILHLASRHPDTVRKRLENETDVNRREYLTYLLKAVEHLEADQKLR